MPRRGAAVLAWAATILLGIAACSEQPVRSPPAEPAPPPEDRPAPTRPVPDTSALDAGARGVPGPAAPTGAAPRADLTRWRVDLQRDERRGGHTIARHVGRTDAQLQARLARESISAASTYVDLATAERVVAEALADNARQVQRWIDRRGPRSNLAIRYRARDALPTGRLLRRGDDASRDVSGAVVVLRWRDEGYLVLTSYPESAR